MIDRRKQIRLSKISSAYVADRSGTFALRTIAVTLSVCGRAWFIR
jgi:hypothetical protein